MILHSPSTLARGGKENFRFAVLPSLLSVAVELALCLNSQLMSRVVEISLHLVRRPQLLVHLVESGSGTFGSTLGWSRCRDIFMRRDSGGHGAGTPQWTWSGHWSPPAHTIPTVL